MTTEEDPECQICHQRYSWHIENQPHHQFVPPGNIGGMAQLGPSNRERGMFPNRRGREEKSHVKVLRGLPSDPALRVLLLRKGVITQEELNEVEREIREAQERGSIVVVMPQLANANGGDREDSRPGDDART